MVYPGIFNGSWGGGVKNICYPPRRHVEVMPSNRQYMNVNAKTIILCFIFFLIVINIFFFYKLMWIFLIIYHFMSKIFSDATRISFWTSDNVTSLSLDWKKQCLNRFTLIQRTSFSYLFLLRSWYFLRK